MNHHVEPPWRTPVIKERSNEKKGEKNKIEALQWLEGASWWWEFGTPGTKRWTKENQEFSYHEQTLKEGIYHLDETRIRIMLCVSFTNLDWWQTTDLAYYLFS